MLALLILFLPLVSVLILAVFGKKLGAIGSVIVTSINIMLALSFSILFLAQSFKFTFEIDFWNWFSLSGLTVPFGFRYDQNTAIMFLIVTLVSSCVHIYSSVYMYTDPHLSRFMLYLSFFTLFMLILVSAGNLVVLFLGWEGVGLCSYLLISFWYTRAQAAKAATKAFLVNKIGDLFFLSAIAFCFIIFGTTDFAALGAIASFAPTSIIEVICALLFIGVIGKSAQIGLHSWLPDAMEGPTPVSALIHAATMVTAGVFLIIRCSFLFEQAPTVSFFIAFVGGLTAILAGTVGVVQNDIKKIIAYSTCSQLGYMVVSAGLALYNISLFHLFNHAFFKALLFLSAGSIIHLMSNEQDIRKMGGAVRTSPFVYICMLVASLSLAGFPFLAGFYSKDLIIEIGYGELWLSSVTTYWMTIAAACLTVSYSLRLLEQVFWEDFNGFKSTLTKMHRITNIEIFVLGLLAVLAITSGFFFKDVFAGPGSVFFGSALSAQFDNFLIEIESLSWSVKLLPTALTIFAFDINFWLFECKWFYNEFVNGIAGLAVLNYGRQAFEQIEKGSLEKLGPIYSVFVIKKALFYNKQSVICASKAKL